MAEKFLQIQEAMDQGKGKVAIRGWIYRERGSSKLKFVVLRDSTNIIQCVIDKGVVGEEKYLTIKKAQIETSIKIYGEIKKEDRAPSGYEVHVSDFEIIGACDTFPITRDQSPEFLLDNRHLWLRSRRMTAILKIRSTYIQARDQFFREKGFWRFDAPILQPNQCEGGSTLFEVKYYKSKTYLSQSWQLYAEAGVFALEKIYNMGPTFRAEKSKTSRHLSEFWMAEAEVAWYDLHDITELAKEELKYCLKKVLEERKEELKLLERDIKKLEVSAKKKWPTIKYREALKILKEKSNMDVK
ncbi:asparagine--tRNA ligase, partial [Candidatus Woesearchaeota archaeon]|nr:asparagine--tRNA ligase [Candidatus Woesearchaeota archaeon]